MLRLRAVLALAFLLGEGGHLLGAPLRNVPQALRQPDGNIVHCFASGDEFRNWLHDSSGYTIVRDPASGYLVYASREGSELRPSAYVVGKCDPAATRIERGVLPAQDEAERGPQQLLGGSPVHPELILSAPRTGQINNLVVFIRFSDESEFSDLVSTYESMFNSSAPDANSMRNYYLEVSYSQLTISTSFYPVPSGATVVSYVDTYTRAYYQPFNAVTNHIGYKGGNDGGERTSREHTLLKNAVNAIASQVPSSLNIDGDSDGNVDNVCFIVDGSPDGWSSLLWPHMWSLYTLNAYINDKRVYTYNFQLQASLASDGVGVLCHEMFHSLGAPDLYHYSYDGMHPVYSWDPMEYTTNPPQHMGAYMKYRYGNWIGSIPVINVTGTYTLNPLASSTVNSYKIASTSPTEFFVLEYRRKMGAFELSLQGEGLLVYRINSIEDGHGNRNGPPDEVYIYRPSGTKALDGTPWEAEFSSEAGRTAINDQTNPTSFLADGSPGGLNISNVSTVGNTISFTYSTQPVPVQMASFSGRYLATHSILLEWMTVSEVNNYGYEVQRRREGESEFTTLPNVFVPGHGTTLVPQQYAYIDSTVDLGTWVYRLKQIDLDGSAHFTDPIEVRILTAVAGATPESYPLSQNYPNPFNPTTRIRFSVEKTGFTTLKVYNVMGEDVGTLFMGTAQGGTEYTATFDGSSLSSGVYFYRLISGETTSLKSMVLMK